MNEQPNINNAPYPAPNSYAVKPLFQKRGIDIIAAAVLVLLSICGVSAVFWNELNLGYTLTYAVTLIFITAFTVKKGVKFNFLFIICGIMSLVCSASFIISSNAAVKIITFLTTLTSAIIWFAYISGKEYKKGDYNLIKYFGISFYRAAGNMPGMFKSLFSKQENKSKTVSHILIGALCAIPAVLVIVPLLASADDAFYSLVNMVFDDYFSLVQKIILGCGASVFVAALVFSLKYDDRAYNYKESSAGVNNASISTFLGVLSFVYVVYLFSQLAYFFSAFSSILPKGYKFTYAQYARRGFFELCVISVINLLFIFTAVLISKKKEGKLSLAIKLPATFITLFTFVIIFTALSKMVMYIGAYGCTVLRICTSAFMIWLVTVFVCVLICLFVKRFDVLKVGLIFALIILAVLGIGNVNAQIAKYNYGAYTSGKLEIDVKYMGQLGAEGIPYLYKLSKNKDSEIADAAKEELSDAYYSYYVFSETTIKDIDSYKEFSKLKKRYRNVGAYSLPKAKAYKILQKYAKEQNGNIYFSTHEPEDYVPSVETYYDDSYYYDW